MKAGERIKEKCKWIRGALGRELRARSHPASKDKRIQTPMQAQQQPKEKRSAGFLQLQRQPCSKLLSGGVSKGAGELGVLGA